MTCCQFAPNGWLLATGASNGQLLFFDAYTGSCVAKKRIGPAHDGVIHAIAVQPSELGFHPQGAAAGGAGKVVYYFASASDDCTVKIWRVECSTEYDAGKGETLREVILSLAINPKLKISN